MTAKSTSNNTDISNRLHSLNMEAYKLRYSDPRQSIDIATRVKSEAHSIKDVVNEAFARINMAFAHFILSSNYPVLKEYLEAQKLLKNHQSLFLYPMLLNYLGNIYESYGDYEKGLDYCLEALRIARNNKFKEVESDTLGIIGTIYIRLCDFDKAIDNFSKSLKIRVQQDNKPAQASSYNQIARTYALSGNFEKSEKNYLKAIDLRTKIQDNSALNWSYMGIASLYEKQKKYKQAVSFYTNAINGSQKQNDKRCQLHCYIGLGRIYMETHKPDFAYENLEIAKKIAKKLNTKALLIDIYYQLSRYYEAKHKTKEAFENYKSYHQIKDEVHNTELLNKLRNQQIKFEVESAQKEAEIYQLRNVELKNALDLVNEKNKQIVDSINYAQHIQAAILPEKGYLDQLFDTYFMLYLPRDIVSGDFYWVYEENGIIFLAIADCTGHGVPGAFMSILGITHLNEIVKNNLDLNAAEILNLLRTNIIESLKQSFENIGSNNGMDLGFCIINRKEKTLQYAGAYNPLLLVKNKELIEVKADRMPIGIHPNSEVPFTNHVLDLEKDTLLYLFSDGYADQFGGDEGKKFKMKNLKDLIIKINHLPMTKQKEELLRRLKKWQGDHERIDDIIIFGMQL